VTRSGFTSPLSLLSGSPFLQILFHRPIYRVRGHANLSLSLSYSIVDRIIGSVGQIIGTLSLVLLCFALKNFCPQK